MREGVAVNRVEALKMLHLTESHIEAGWMENITKFMQDKDSFKAMLYSGYRSTIAINNRGAELQLEVRGRMYLRGGGLNHILQKNDTRVTSAVILMQALEKEGLDGGQISRMLQPYFAGKRTVYYLLDIARLRKTKDAEFNAAKAAAGYNSWGDTVPFSAMQQFYDGKKTVQDLMNTIRLHQIKRGDGLK